MNSNCMTAGAIFMEEDPKTLAWHFFQSNPHPDTDHDHHVMDCYEHLEVFCDEQGYSAETEHLANQWMDHFVYGYKAPRS